jgi:hypothetical protein
MLYRNGRQPPLIFLVEYSSTLCCRASLPAHLFLLNPAVIVVRAGRQDNLNPALLPVIFMWFVRTMQRFSGPHTVVAHLRLSLP